MIPDPFLPFQILGAVTGILGGLLLALGPRFGYWGFWAFLASNLGWIVFAYGHEFWWQLGMQGCFLMTTFLGLWRWRDTSTRGDL